MLVPLVLATVLCGVLGGAQALGVAACAWGVVMVALLVRRLRNESFSAPVRRLCLLFLAANAVWLAADLLAVGGVPLGTDAPTAVDGLALLGTLVFCAVIAWVGKMRGLWPDAARQLDGVVFAVSLFAPLWFTLVEPQGAPVALVMWGAGALLLMGFGATYILGGGLWNVPAVLLALGVVGNVGVELAIRIGEANGSIAEGSALAARHGIGFVLWSFVALHPRLADVFASGHRTDGIPLGSRVWLLAPCVALPITILGRAYVLGDPLPITLVVGTLGVLCVLGAPRAVAEARSGVEGWHVSLTISLTTLVAASAAVGLALAGQSAQRAQAQADRLAATIPAVERLDAMLLRATGAPDSRVAAAGDEWSRTSAALRRQLGEAEPGIEALLRTYLVRGDEAIAAGDSAERRVDEIAGPAYASLLEGLRESVAVERGQAADEGRRARLLTVAGLFGALVAITLLLLRFSFAGRRLAVTHLGRHDALTGLPNRAALEGRLCRTAAPAGARAPHQTLVLLDLDDFKTINDVHGHPVGDALLRAVARRLDDLTRGDELLARVEGDAFVVLIEGAGREEEAVGIAQRMLNALAEPFPFAGEQHLVRGSIGIAATDGTRVADDDGSLVLLRDAELAMYEAKRLPGNTVEFFAPAMHEAARDRLALTADLRRAIEREELHLVYQPIVDLQTGRALGYEALARWNHPERGPLSPADFIPLAEATGLVVPLGGWVLREACRQLQAWQADWTDLRYISVNVAGQQLANGLFPGQVRDALDAAGLPAEQLLLEVTESSLIENVDAALGQMAEVKALGARFALDDFGTGYSSLSYLRQFRVDVVKVDKSFIDDVVDTDGSSLVEAIVHMAASLRMKVVAEGIEETEQADVLRRLGCELGQGFRYSRPLPAGDVLGAPPVFGLPKAATSPLRVAPAGSRVA